MEFKDYFYGFCSEIRNDKDLQRAYRDNIAMAFKDEFGRNINEFIHKIANDAAQNFLDILISKKDTEEKQCTSTK